MSVKVTGKWALVTGASGGMGADFARDLAKRGYNLIITARRAEALAELTRTIGASHPDIEIRTLSGNLAERSFRDRLIGEFSTLPVEVLVNNAGAGAFGAFDAIPEDKEDAMLDLDIKALVHLTRVFALSMKSRGAGYILQTASIAAFQPCPFFASYAAAKSFVLSYGLAARTELRGTGVRVTVLCPGVTDTGFFDAAEQAKLSFFQRMSMMKSEPVVRGSLRALFAGKAVYTPGFLNRMNALFVRFLPASLAARIAGGLAA